jgi:hypothetical protein
MAQSGQESLAQGLPWVAKIMFFALKWLEKWKRAVVRGEWILAFILAPSGLIRVGELPRVNPGLSFLGHFGPDIRP